VVVPFLVRMSWWTPEHLPAGRHQAGDRHLNSHKLRGNLIEDTPDTYLADAGYCPEDNLAAIEDFDAEVLVATGRQRYGEQFPTAPRGPIPKSATRRDRMARRLRTRSGRADYARRKAIVEPAFGQMKVRQHAGALRLRDRDGAQGDWTIHAICHNLRKPMGARSALGLAAA